MLEVTIIFIRGGQTIPVYEYLCKNQECKNNTEAFEMNQKITDDPIQECPMCKRGVERLISNTSFILKGSGFTPRHY